MAKKVILYGSPECPPCREIKQKFDDAGIHYGFIDVTASLAHLKKFMVFRDANYDRYKGVVEMGSVGIPTVVVDDTEIYIEDVNTVDISVYK